jgi:hypothetical protein
MTAASHPIPEMFDGFDAYCDALRCLRSLTPIEYLYLLQQELAWGEESHGETVTQYRSECARFGDAGPGQALQVYEGQRMLAETRAKIERVKRIIANTTA